MIALTEAWDLFEGYVEAARAKILNTHVPVALICLQGEINNSELDIFPEKEAMIIWPKDIPMAQRGPLLKRLGASYENTKVKEVEHGD
jgi:hypothetical protein